MIFNLVICGIMVALALVLEHKNFRGYALITVLWAGVIGILAINGNDVIRYIAFIGYPCTMAGYLISQALSLTLDTADTFLDSH